ncbi:MAG TPA: hypothetical protein DIU15_05990 [Deltaproteobacteria bacterium]|nr:hypothetical protein [Deltaproteobacteria bacterium]HCP45570.1 hypothetical protein [Deltaproteobacteria bacterium]
MLPRASLVLLSLLLVVLAGCSPRNPIGGGEEEQLVEATCGATANSWPEVSSNHIGYEGNGASSGDFLWNFQLADQFGDTTCLSQFLGNVLIIDVSTRWCGPCNEAAEESPELWAQMQEIGPSWILTLMAQDAVGLPATSQDVVDWVDQYELEYPVLLDHNEQTREAWEVLSFPLFLFVAPTGEIVERIEQRPDDSDVLGFVQQAVEQWSGDLRPSE